MIKRVLHVLPAFETGGVEHYVKDVITRFAIKYPDRTFYIASNGGQLVDLLPSNVVHFKVPLHRKLSIFANAKRLESICKEHAIERLHAHSRAPAWACYSVSMWLEISYSTTFHGVYSHHNFIKRFYNKAMLMGDYVIAVSKYIEDHIKTVYKLDNEKIKTIPEGIDTTLFDPCNFSEADRLHIYDKHNIPFYHRLILLPGRFSKIKGQKFAIEAIKGIENVTLMLIGKPSKLDDYTRELINLVEFEKLPVIFVEATDNLPLYYAAAHVVLSLCTKPEAYGRVIAEALAMEKVLITTNHGGALELTDNGNYAILVPPSNPDAVRGAIEKALTLSELDAAMMTKSGREFIRKNYNIDQMVDSLKELMK